MKFNITILAAALLIVGCNKAEIPQQNIQDGTMKFNVVYPATKATETAFEPGDKIGVYVTAYENGQASPLQLGGNFKNNNPVTYDGSKWVADPVIYWNDDIAKYDVYSYYPFMLPTSVDELPFSVALDQRVEATETSLSAYEASDFLYSNKKGVTQEDGDVNLIFKHKMSKFTVNLIKGDDYEGELPDEAVVLVHSTVPECLIDLSTGDVVKDPYASAKTITAKQVDPGQYTAIIVPQMLTNKKPLVEINYKDVSYMVETKFNFKTGTHHVINITLSSNPEKVKIEIGGEIENWQ